VTARADGFGTISREAFSIAGAKAPAFLPTAKWNPRIRFVRRTGISSMRSSYGMASSFRPAREPGSSRIAVGTTIGDVAPAHDAEPVDLRATCR
jgi:hypothetical protein